MAARALLAGMAQAVRLELVGTAFSPRLLVLRPIGQGEGAAVLEEPLEALEAAVLAETIAMALRVLRTQAAAEAAVRATLIA